MPVFHQKLFQNCILTKDMQILANFTKITIMHTFNQICQYFATISSEFQINCIKRPNRNAYFGSKVRIFVKSTKLVAGVGYTLTCILSLIFKGIQHILAPTFWMIFLMKEWLNPLSLKYISLSLLKLNFDLKRCLPLHLLTQK
ncbi:hypothetical protein AMTRI_Chr03g55590 [Amborella trichopoda]